MQITQSKSILVDHGNSNQGSLENKNKNLKKKKNSLSQKIQHASHSVIVMKIPMQGYTMLSRETEKDI